MAAAAPRTHLVDSLWISRAPLAFRELCERAVPPETRLLVLDLDRTLHLDRNMGELLGWEICAHQSYGPAYLADLEPRRGSGRFYFDWSRPGAVLGYLWRSVRVWGRPGLFYLLWGKIAARVAMLRRRAYRRFGLEPVAAVQRIPQDVLFGQMRTLPAPVVRELGRRVWQRHRPDQTIEREDLDWLRRRCPGIRVVLSSASPREMVEIAALALGVEDVDVIGSSPDRINGGRAKLAGLRARYPELSDGAVTVGISDTGYGEDHCWTEAFTHVVDVNSSAPFPPIVLGGSPLRAIFSAPLLTRAEKDARARGEPGLDPRRKRLPGGADRAFGQEELAALLAPVRAAVERLAAELQAALDENERRIGEAVARGRADAAQLAFRLSRLLERSRRLLERPRVLAREPARRARPLG